MSPKKTRIHFTNPRGFKLAGTCVYPEGELGAWALYANCFTCTKDFKSSKWLAEALAEHGFGVLLFDPTGLGRSEGDFADSNFSTLTEDLRAAADWMTKNGKAPALQIGHSIGGLATLAVAPALASVRGIVTLAAPSTLKDIRGRMLRQAPHLTTAGEGMIQFGERPYLVKKQMLDDFTVVDVEALASGVGKPWLIIHSRSDEILLFDHAEQLYALAAEPKRLVALPDFPHLSLERSQLKFIAGIIADWATGLFNKKAQNLPDGTG